MTATFSNKLTSRARARGVDAFEKGMRMSAVEGANRSGIAKSLLLSASLLPFLAIASPALAQDSQTPALSTTRPTAPTPENRSLPRSADNKDTAAPAADAADQDIVVTGFRKSLATAQAIKFNADQFVDSITATDIGKLPDKNVAEALQRISGVQITRNYGEGSSVAIRGLTQVKTELNGRDVFGGSGGRSLGFEDVPSELLGGVDVYKDPSAKEIEGGIGGMINLRTRMPFDEKGFVVSTTMGANYFDLSKQARFNGSILASKTWQNTPIGEIGVLVDLSYYESSFRRDQATIEPYVPTTTVPGYVGKTMYVPDGAGIQVTQGDRARKGIYAALQWKPASNVEVYGTYFRSQYDISTPNYSAFVTNGTSTDQLRYLSPNAASRFKFASDGTFVSGGYNGFIPAYSGITPGFPDFTQYQNTALNLATNTQVSFTRTVTTDYAGGVKWSISPRLHATLDGQYERATATNNSYTAFAQKALAGYQIDLSGSLPTISFQSAPGGASNTDLSSYVVNAVMDHLEDSVATQKAGRLDLTWDFDNSILQSIQGGIRYTDRSAINRSTPYNWTYAGGQNLTLASPASSGVLAPYGTLFGGQGTNIVGAVPYVDAAVFNNPAAAFQTLGGRSLIHFGPLDVNTQREKTYAGYLTAYFKVQAGLPIDGNIAVRVVKTTNDAIGTTQLSYRTSLIGTTPDVGAVTIFTPYSASQNYTKVLPSLNLRAHITSKLQLRAAASEGLSRPNFADLRAIRSVSINYNAVRDPVTNQILSYVPNGGTGNGGNPLLKPLTTDQADLALEWNAGRTTFLYGTIFYKKLKNFTTTQVFNQSVTPPGGTAQTVSYTALVNGTDGKVKGAELGGNTFFDFLPGPLAGFGVQANVTYVDSSAPGSAGTLFDGTAAPTQLQGLSKWSYNVVGLYEKYGVSARAAYNWRSSYVDSISSNGTGAVPILYRPYGQLDTSIAFNFTPKVSMTIDATNLLRAKYNSYQYFAQDPRNYELNDRRFGITFRMRN